MTAADSGSRAEPGARSVAAAAGSRTTSGEHLPIWSHHHRGVTPRQLFVHGGFRRLYAARVASQLADGILNAALVSFVVFSPAHATSAGKIAAALAVTLVPYSVIAPFAGIIIDRVSRRQALVWANVLRAGVLGLLAALVGAGHTGTDFYLTALVAYSLSRFVLAILGAGLPRVVPARELVSANSLSTITGAVVGLTGAAIGAGMRAIIGATDGKVALVVLLAGFAYLVAAAVSARLGRTEIGPLTQTARGSVRHEAAAVLTQTRDGARGLWSIRPARDALTGLTVSRLGYGLSLVATIVLYRNYFHDGMAGLGMLTAFTGLGAASASFLTPAGTRWLGARHWLAFVFLLAGAAEVAFVLPYTQASLLVAGTIIGFALQAAKISTDTIVQATVPDALRGRAFSVYDTLFSLSYVGAAQLARFVPADGKSTGATLGVAAAYAAAGVVYLICQRHGHAASACELLDASGPGGVDAVLSGGSDLDADTLDPAVAHGERAGASVSTLVSAGRD